MICRVKAHVSAVILDLCDADRVGLAFNGEREGDVVEGDGVI